MTKVNMAPGRIPGQRGPEADRPRDISSMSPERMMVIVDVEGTLRLRLGRETPEWGE